MVHKVFYFQLLRVIFSQKFEPQAATGDKKFIFECKTGNIFP